VVSPEPTEVAGVVVAVVVSVVVVPVDVSVFKVPDSGDTVGNYVQYFGGGSIRGKFDLTPDQNGDVSSTDFTSESWTGIVTVTGGTGTLAKASGKKGVIRCTSGDSVHLTCTSKLKLKQL
jgi:hypothetical protein